MVRPYRVQASSAPTIRYAGISTTRTWVGMPAMVLFPRLRNPSRSIPPVCPPPVRTSATELYRNSVPSVAIRAGIRTTVTRKPLRSPSSSPATSATTAASQGVTPRSCATRPMTTPERLMVEPTERSIPPSPPRITIDWPSASSPTTAPNWVMDSRLSSCRKYGDSRLITTPASSSRAASTTRRSENAATCSRVRSGIEVVISRPSVSRRGLAGSARRWRRRRSALSRP